MPRPPPYKMMQISPSDGEERVLGELSALGLTALAYRSVTVLDRAGLEALAFPPDP